jgi:two-component system cell cycle response regulator
LDDRKKILIVDDTAMFREIESLFLASAGTVLGASNGAQALEIARREHPDVVVADLDMPDMDGETLCRAIKADRDLHRTPVILVTSGRSGLDRERAVRAHADDVLSKPLSRIQLNVAVGRLLRSDGYRSLTRVELDAEVRVRVSRDQASVWGTVRDLSRGGVFVESSGTLPLATEVDLAFRLPITPKPIQPTAQVMWAGRHPVTGAPGMGLRFLALDRISTGRIDEYIHERVAPGVEARATAEATL